MDNEILYGLIGVLALTPVVLTPMAIKKRCRLGIHDHPEQKLPKKKLFGRGVIKVVHNCTICGKQITLKRRV